MLLCIKIAAVFTEPPNRPNGTLPKQNATYQNRPNLAITRLPCKRQTVPYIEMKI